MATSKERNQEQGQSTMKPPPGRVAAGVECCAAADAGEGEGFHPLA